MVLGKSGAPHTRIRSSCKWCGKRRHDATRHGNTDRFHGYGSFCLTHGTTGRAKKYCTTQGKSKERRTGTGTYKPLQRVEFRKNGRRITIPRRDLKKKGPMIRSEGYTQVRRR